MTTATTARTTREDAVRARSADVTHRPRGRAVVPDAAERRAALLGASALLAMGVLWVSAVRLLDDVTAGSPTVDPAVAFLAVAGFDVVVGCALYRLLRAHAAAPAHAVVVSRIGYAALLTSASALLLWRGQAGVAPFADDSSDAMLVLGIHLLTVSVALWRSRIAPGFVILATAAAGAAALVDVALVWSGTEPMGGTTASVLAGEVVLMCWLFRTGLRRSDASLVR